MIIEQSVFRDPIVCEYSDSMAPGYPDFHFHTHYELFFLLSGSLSFYAEHSCYQLQPGDLVILTNQELHKAQNLTDCPYCRLVIHLAPAYLASLSTPLTSLLECFQRRKPGTHNVLSLSPSQQEDYIRLFHCIRQNYGASSYGSDLSVTASLQQLLLMVNRLFREQQPPAADAPSSHSSQIISYISAHLMEDFTLDDIAGYMALDKYYLCHLFKKETGSTIFQYIQAKRLCLAQLALSRGASVTEACEEAGFNDYSNFIRTFRKILGCTPGEYQKQVLKQKR